ncbi:hypothetical protein [Bradyrhizobium sp.]|uniref:hypothetical protein n=1 Tax=Bradyrhizobium sp. TaxID=376 RepID=UPI003C69BF88
MGNVFPPGTSDTRIPESRLRDDDDGFDSDLNTDMIMLLEENARLRALVTQLSSLVLKHVVDQK